MNDLVGHAGGDLVLAQAARRLRAAVPPSATVARWGGDEFAVLVGSDATAAEVIDLAERLAGLIAAEPFSVAAKEIALTVSVGAAVAAASGQADQILGHAEIALAKAQEAGVGRVEIFAPAHARRGAAPGWSSPRTCAARSPSTGWRSSTSRSSSLQLGGPRRRGRQSAGPGTARSSRRRSSWPWPRSPG